MIGLSSLYKLPFNFVLLGGVNGDVFQISWSVRQGYRLAPYLFLFFVEAICLSFVAKDVGLNRIAMLVDGTNVVDVELVDGTILYLDDQILIYEN